MSHTRRQLAAVILILTACERASTNSAKAPDAGSWNTRADAIKAHVGFLADDALEGRGSGTRGFDLAARYVRSQLMAFGANRSGAEALFAGEAHDFAQIVALKARGCDGSRAAALECE